MAKAYASSWEVTDEFCARAEPLVPQPVREPLKQYRRRAGARRPFEAPHLVFEAIVYVLKTGYQWKALPAERFGSASAVHQRFLQWSRAGFFESLWKTGLAEYDKLESIAWRWQRIGGRCSRRLWLQSGGSGMEGSKCHLSVDRCSVPLSLAAAGPTRMTRRRLRRCSRPSGSNNRPVNVIYGQILKQSTCSALLLALERLLRPERCCRSPSAHTNPQTELRSAVAPV